MAIPVELQMIATTRIWMLKHIIALILSVYALKATKCVRIARSVIDSARIKVIRNLN